MLESLFGNRTAEQVLLYLQNYEEAYARQIAATFDASLNAVQKQLRRFEDGGVLVSRTVGRTRVFTWNPRYPFKAPLRDLLSSALECLPESEKRAGPTTNSAVGQDEAASRRDRHQQFLVGC